MKSKNQFRFTLCTTIVALSFASMLNTFAGPPFLTDDPEPVPYQSWEFYAASQHAESSDGWSGTAPHIEFNYGVVTNMQLHVIVPLSYDAPSNDKHHYGLGDVEAGVKYRFVQESDWMPQVGVFPLLEIPTGNSDEGLGNGHLQAFLPVWLQKSWDDWTAYGGGGYGINSGKGNQNWGFVGMVLQKEIATNWIVGAEVFHQTSLEKDGRDNTAFNIGTVFDLSEQHHLMFSAGRSIDGPSEFQCYVAYQFTFENSLLQFWNRPQH